MNQMTSDRESRIIDAAGECESDESLARVAAGILELLAQRGLTAWEALGRRIIESGSKEEITLQMEQMLLAIEVNDQEDEIAEEDIVFGDERSDPEEDEDADA